MPRHGGRKSARATPARSNYGAPIQRPRLLPAGQALDLLHDEAQLVALCGANVASGVKLSAADLGRLLQAAGRIAYLRDEVRA